ncbi:tetratricopeptide repeat protein [Mucilaginibacter sp. OK283]|jgi:tetratricopeptide (TPR) repeat protein|uniref:tetratricopeptide repeat protein n=1 Tax=Mucilaginibacter sp. OK283 TaxID=1881049 RepID=UPI0008C0E68A|nr:tetratricopeptide repeat protein [Mucilaginibacter sp. OK283]SEP36397.1 Tetratricopeptide repeat-containing protein [Mucilaginibacter sp. OK283]
MKKFALLLTVLPSLLLSVFNAKAQFTSGGIKKADSLFFAQNWTGAQKQYRLVLADTSHNGLAWNRLGFCEYNLGNYQAAIGAYQKALMGKPAAPLKAIVYSRRAKVYALQGKIAISVNDLDSATAYGYSNLAEMDTLNDFGSLRNNPGFKQIRQKVYFTLNPCMANAQARQFDFWVGEWNVYPTGTNTLAGHSLVQMVSGGCALLENWEATNGSSSGKSLNFIDEANGKWKQTWVGNYANGIQEFVNGQYADGAMRFTFTTTDAQGHPLTGRFIFYNLGADKVRQFNETSADGGKTWVTAYDFTYIRIKKGKM